LICGRGGRGCGDDDIRSGGRRGNGCGGKSGGTTNVSIGNEGRGGDHFTTGVAEGLERSTVFVEVGFEGTGSRGIELHQEIGNQVEYFGWHLE